MLFSTFSDLYKGNRILSLQHIRTWSLIFQRLSKGIPMSERELDRGGWGGRGTEEMDERGKHVNEKGLCREKEKAKRGKT